MQETATISTDSGRWTSDPARDRRLLIGGRLVETERTFPSLNPATGEVLGYAPDATVADAEAAVAAAARGVRHQVTGRPTPSCGSGASSSSIRRWSSIATSSPR